MSARDGLVYGMPEIEYHAGPELSSTGAKRILRSPAHYQWEQEHRVEKAAYDFGHAVHALVLGTGLDIEVIDADGWRTKAAQDARKAAYAEGKVPMLAKDHARAVNTAVAVRSHPIAGPLFVAGEPEVSMFWTDETTGVRCRGRIDWLKDFADGRTAIDLKTAADADPATWGRITAKYAYDLQAAWYLDGYQAVTGVVRLDYLHVVVESNPPHAVSVVRLDDEALHIGALKAARARLVFAECSRTGQWPGYPEIVHPVGLPQWAIYEAEDEYDDEMVV